MATTRSPQVRARERARAQLADKLAAQRAREKANEDDLAAFFAHAEQLDTAAATRDATIAAAHQTYTNAIRTAQTDQHQRIRALAERGEKVADIAELTGWSLTEVRKALRAQPAVKTDTTEAKSPSSAAAASGEHDSTAVAEDGIDERPLAATSVA